MELRALCERRVLLLVDAVRVLVAANRMMGQLSSDPTQLKAMVGAVFVRSVVTHSAMPWPTYNAARIQSHRTAS